jgi:hypothetical protein
LAQLTIYKSQPRFLHLGVNFAAGDSAVQKALIEEHLNKAKDWLRYAPSCWLIYTSKNSVHWANVLRSISEIKDNTTFLICEIDLSKRSGWLHDSAWKWINKTRAGATDQAERP